MIPNVLLDLCIMIFGGMLMGRAAKLVHLPNVTGYLVAGLIIGGEVIKDLTKEAMKRAR